MTTITTTYDTLSKADITVLIIANKEVSKTRIFVNMNICEVYEVWQKSKKTDVLFTEVFFFQTSMLSPLN